MLRGRIMGAAEEESQPGKKHVSPTWDILEPNWRSSLVFFFFSANVLLCLRVCGILVPWPGMEPVPCAVESQSLNHTGPQGKSLEVLTSQWWGVGNYSISVNPRRPKTFGPPLLALRTCYQISLLDGWRELGLPGEVPPVSPPAPPTPGWPLTSWSPGLKFL